MSDYTESQKTALQTLLSAPENTATIPARTALSLSARGLVKKAGNSGERGRSRVSLTAEGLSEAQKLGS